MQPFFLSFRLHNYIQSYVQHVCSQYLYDLADVNAIWKSKTQNWNHGHFLDETKTKIVGTCEVKQPQHSK